MKKLAVAVGVILVSSVGAADALEATFDVLGVTEISNGMGGTRILLDTERVTGLAEELILSARLKIPLTGVTPLTEVNIRATGLTRSWSTLATWITPWFAPGGDVDPTQSAMSSLRAGNVANSLDLDVTDIVRSIAEGDAVDFGLVLRPDDLTRMGFNGAEMAVLGGLQGGQIRVSYRKLTAYGIRGGAAAHAARKRSQRGDDGSRGDD